MTLKKAAKLKKPSRRRCAGCNDWFQPRRNNQTNCKAACRYKRFASKVQRVRLKVLPLESMPIWHAVQSSDQPKPLALFEVREHADAFARYLRRRQRKENPAARVRVSVGMTFSPDTQPVKNSTGKPKPK